MSKSGDGKNYDGSGHRAINEALKARYSSTNPELYKLSLSPAMIEAVSITIGVIYKELFNVKARADLKFDRAAKEIVIFPIVDGKFCGYRPKDQLLLKKIERLPRALGMTSVVSFKGRIGTRAEWNKIKKEADNENQPKHW